MPHQNHNLFLRKRAWGGSRVWENVLESCESEKASKVQKVSYFQTLAMTSNPIRIEVKIHKETIP